MRSFPVVFLALLFSSLYAGGCSSLKTSQTAGLGELPVPYVAETAKAAPQQSVPYCTIVVKPNGRKAETTQMPLKERKFVHDALKHAHVFSRFSKVNVKILRQSEKGGQPYRMGVRCNVAKHAVSGGSDYDLHPGDRIVIIEDNTSPLDSILGPFAGAIMGK